jgi:hypothetical protein
MKAGERQTFGLVRDYETRVTKYDWKTRLAGENKRIDLLLDVYFAVLLGILFDDAGGVRFPSSEKRA